MERSKVVVRSMRWLVLVALAAMLALGGCSCEDEGTTGGNGGSGADGGLDGGLDADTGAGADTGGGADTDGGADTGGDASCGAQATVCGDSCCPNTDECIDDQCLPACAGTRCGAGQALCCTGQEVCLGGGCVTPGADCDRTEQCGLDEICEPTLGQCVPRSAVEVCEFIPPVGDFQPEQNCRWRPAAGDQWPNHDSVEAAPIVLNVTDDNGDGLTNTDDIPDIIFPAHNYDANGCCSNPSVVRIVSGECNADGTMTTLGSIPDPAIESSAGIAGGDLTGDGIPEIVGVTKVTGAGQGTAAWTRTADDGSTWQLLWHNQTYPTFNVHTRGGAIVSLADLEGDGNPEVIVGNVVLNGQDGTLKWDGVATSGGSGGIGNNAFLGPSSSVGDINLDGFQEVAAGNTLYSHTGDVLWTYAYTSSNSGCQGGLPCDGFSAMADFDQDPEGEVVIVRRGEVFILEHTGELLWKQAIPIDNCMHNNQPANEAGPPTIADFDGDGRPEVGTAAADFYTVLDMDCDADPLPDGCHSRGVLWAAPNQDCSSRVTASSVFDFEGDGKAEMVYADEVTFKILDGTDGTTLFQDDDHRSNTRIEMPIVVDVDNDGNAEAIVPAPYENGGVAKGSANSNRGITVWGDTSDNWVRTRRIWNQHAYSVTNVNEDGTIPTRPQPNWRNARLNNFRQNIQPGGVFDAPDLGIESIGIEPSACAAATDVEIVVEVANRGALGVSAGLPVHIFLTHQANTIQHATLTTQTRLLPGQTETLRSPWTMPDGWRTDGFSVRAVIDPDGSVNECDEGNNDLEAASTDLIQAAPDLSVGIAVQDAACGTANQLHVTVDAQASGQNPVPAGVPIVVEAVTGAGVRIPIQTVQTSRELQPGESESFEFDWTVDDQISGTTFDVEATVDPDQTVYACPDNPRASAEADCTPAG